MEHRWGRRLKMQLPVSVSVPGGPAVAGTVIDISLSGAFVRLPADLPDLGIVDIEFIDLPFADLVPLRAQIVRSTGMGVGLEWAADEAAVERSILLLTGAAPGDPPERTPDVIHDMTRSLVA